MKTPLNQGWALNDGQDHSHYYLAGQTDPLCAYGLPNFGEREDAGHNHPTNCSYCRSMRLRRLPIEKERSVAA